MTENTACPLCSQPHALQRNQPRCILWPVLSDLCTASEFPGTREEAASNIYMESFYPPLQYLAFLPKLRGTATEISHDRGELWRDDGLLEHTENRVWTPLPSTEV